MPPFQVIPDAQDQSAAAEAPNPKDHYAGNYPTYDLHSSVPLIDDLQKFFTVTGIDDA